jgi:hypothetical protein
MQAVANPREERGHEIATTEGQVFRVAEGYYKVRSQSISVERYYDVNNTSIGWKCNCLITNSEEPNVSTFGLFRSALE